MHRSAQRRLLIGCSSDCQSAPRGAGRIRRVAQSTVRGRFVAQIGNRHLGVGDPEDVGGFAGCRDAPHRAGWCA